MGRFQRSIALAKQSFGVLHSNPQLLWFPIVSSIFSIAVSISFMLPMYFTAGGIQGMERTKHLPPGHYVVLGLFYFCTSFVVIFFNAGLVSCAYAGLRGERMTFGEGVAEAAKRIPAIFGWTLISATVGLVLQMISERVGIIGKIVVAILGGAWSLITFFVIPVMVVEHGSPIAAIKKSGSLLKRTWGENLIGSAGLGLIFFLYALVPVVAIVLSAFTGNLYLILISVALSVVYWIILATVAASLNGIFRTALYLYAETGQVPQAYTAEMLQFAFSQGKPNMVNRLRNR